MKQIQPRENYLGVGGWVWGGKYKLERYLYLLHRVTGLGLILFVLVHLIMTTVFRIQGQDIWEATMTILHNPWFKVILQELGFALGKSAPPVYPFKDSLRKKRPLTFAIIAVVVILAAVFLFDFLKGGW